MNRSNTNVLCSALAFTAIVGSFFLPTLVSVADGQSPMNMMSKIMMGGNGDNETDDEMMQIMGGNMSRMPFKMGVMAMPLMCTTPGDIISGQFEADADTEGNETQDKSMNEMIQQMMMSGNGSNGMNSNMTMNEMIQQMMMSGNGSNGMNSNMTMNEMIQQMMMSGNGSNGMNSNMTGDDSQEQQNAMNMNNMTDSEAELEQAMSMNICFPMMDEGMMKEMMGIMGWG
jgi:hypothetical protein